MFPYCVQRAEISAPRVTVYAYVAYSDLLTEIRDKSREVYKIFGIWDEEGMGGGHMRKVVL